MHGLGLGIALSKINTEGTKVADVFYVNELDGSKVAPGPRFKAIRAALLAAVSAESTGTESGAHVAAAPAVPNTHQPDAHQPNAHRKEGSA
jgi:[protein-PII] uridylyltransferase